MQSKATKREMRFCTACGAELDEFWSDPRVGDLKELIQKRVNCIETGRPANRLCSKLFIAGAHTPVPATENKKGVSRKKLTELKTEVLGRIEEEEAKQAKQQKKKRAAGK
jgi:hypothetical protein